MERSRGVIAVLLLVVGLVWIGQGTGVLRGNSFMVDDVRWALVGAACVAAAMVMLARSRLRARR